MSSEAEGDGPQPDRIKHARHFLEYAGLRAAKAVVSRLPYDGIEPLADMLGDAAYTFDSRGRAVALENLRLVFGDTFSPDRRKEIARGSYRNFARTMLCLLWSENIRDFPANQFVEVEGLEDHPIHTTPGQAGIYFCFHFSNFEWLSHAAAMFIEKGIIIAQKFKNPRLGPVFNELRSSTGHTIIPQERAIVRMLKRLKEGGKFGVLTDLSLDPRHGAVPIRCFGRWISASPMLSVLRQRTGAALIPCEAVPMADGRYRMRYLAPLDLPADADAHTITQTCWDVLEPSIRKNPELWLWPYKQWRFRPEDADPADYPEYANVARRFDRLMANAGIND